jgi:hypothetical protein
MTVFLKWKDYAPRTENRTLADLFSTLSSRWYPTNIIADDATYHILKMMGNEIASASVETGQVLSDLSIDTVRTVPVVDQTTTKIYDNFGALVGTDKLYIQDYESYTSSSVDLMPYRQELRFLILSCYAGTSYEGIKFAGQAFTGISPIIIDKYKEYPGWTLTLYTGSVVAAGNNFVVIDRYIPRIGRIIPTSSASLFVPGTHYAISYTKLGTNTIIHSAQSVYHGIDIHVFASEYSSGSVEPLFEEAVTKILRADIVPRFFYSDVYVGYHTDGILGSGSSDLTYNYDEAITTGTNVYSEEGFIVSDGNYVTNTDSVNERIIYGRPVVLPLSTYPNFNWYYDCAALVFNDAHYNFGIRQYSSASIPPTVYFEDYNNVPLEYLSFPAGTDGTHWIFDTSDEASDISGNGATLARSGSVPIPILGRSETWLGQSIDYDEGVEEVFYSNTTGSVLNFTNSFTCEVWLKGIDNLSLDDNIVVRVRHEENGVTGLNILNDSGYMFMIAPMNNNVSLSVYKNSVLSSVTADISNITSELPSRYHYFAVTYYSGSVMFYRDDKCIGSDTLPWPLPSLSGNIFTSVELQSSPALANSFSVGVDEVMWSNAVLTPEMAKTRFEQTKPRLCRLGRTSYNTEEYQQPRWVVWSSGSLEFELHHFSVRGLEYPHQYVLNRRNASILDIPIFSGSVF